MNKTECRYLLALKCIPGVGNILAKQLISYCGSAKAIFEEKKGVLLKIPNIGKKTVDALFATKTLVYADECLSLCIKHGVEVVSYDHVTYPPKLKFTNDAPLLVYKKGQMVFPDRKIVSIVGTRNATEYGKHTTEKIVEELVGHHAVVVSGLAYGIDITAHRAALKRGLPTVAVLAGGLDTIYPAAHKQVADEMLESGGWVSENLPGVKPEAHYFPARNRIIAGMSDTLIVVEAANKGGALITANIAYSYNREVFAVPGNLANKYSAGCNALIRSQRANIYTSVKDLEYILGWEKGNISPPKSIDIAIFSDHERKILTLLVDNNEGQLLDELSWKTQISVSETLSILLQLEFAGLVKSLPGKRYKIGVLPS